ncbi:MAG TPA: ROK family protein [Solirubrobacteraceae bacterium]|jgi:glucokinase|nr:ROK family protein [Solirubrobacteraceae bacterium]
MAAARGGIDLGGTKIQCVVVDESQKVLGSARGATPTAGGPADVAAAMAAAMREAATGAGLSGTSELAGVGVGSPGAVDETAGTVSGAGNLPDWAGSFPLGPALSEALGTTVTLGNDVGVATEAEVVLGAGREASSLIGVFWGTGVGSGIVLDRRPWHGRGAAGEIGHTVVKIGGRRCLCGRRGCVEAYAGRAAMEARARKLQADGRPTDLFKLMEKHGRARLTSSIWARALERKDGLATELIHDAIEALGAGIASAINLLDLEMVVIGGGLGVRLGQPYVERIKAAMHPHLFVDDRPPDVLLAELGDMGGAIGAALLVAAAPKLRAAAPKRRAAGPSKAGA